ncbi:hypothetical protein AWENTII_002787 [Aspergillus wentii]
MQRSSPVQSHIQGASQINASGLTSKHYVSHEALKSQHQLNISHPIKQGIIRDWHEMEEIWRRTFLELKVNPEEHNVLMTEAPESYKNGQEAMVQKLFDVFKVPAVAIIDTASLALFALGAPLV